MQSPIVPTSRQPGRLSRLEEDQGLEGSKENFKSRMRVCCSKKKKKRTGSSTDTSQV